MPDQTTRSHRYNAHLRRREHDKSSEIPKNSWHDLNTPYRNVSATMHVLDTANEIDHKKVRRDTEEARAEGAEELSLHCCAYRSDQVKPSKQVRMVWAQGQASHSAKACSTSACVFTTSEKLLVSQRTRLSVGVESKPMHLVLPTLPTSSMKDQETIPSVVRAQWSLLDVISCWLSCAAGSSIPMQHLCSDSWRPADFLEGRPLDLRVTSVYPCSFHKRFRLK